jgi:hypothetical protein
MDSATKNHLLEAVQTWKSVFYAQAKKEGWTLIHDHKRDVYMIVGMDGDDKEGELLKFLEQKYNDKAGDMYTTAYAIIILSEASTLTQQTVEILDNLGGYGHVW